MTRSTQTSLSERDKQILEIEEQHWRYAGTKEAAIVAAGLTPVRYYQRLNALLNDEGAIEAAPLTMNRLRRLDAARRRRRA